MSCRTDPTAKPHPHACSWQHQAVVDGYQAARAAWEATAEAATGGYGTEMDEYRQAHPAPTFRSWLTQTGTRQEEDPP